MSSSSVREHLLYTYIHATHHLTEGRKKGNQNRIQKIWCRMSLCCVVCLVNDEDHRKAFCSVVNVGWSTKRIRCHENKTEWNLIAYLVKRCVCVCMFLRALNDNPKWECWKLSDRIMGRQSFYQFITFNKLLSPSSNESI